MNMDRYRPIPTALTDSLRPIDDWGPPAERFYETPEAPGKVIRWEDVAPDIVEELPYINDLLQELEGRYGIPTVRPQYAIADTTVLENAHRSGIEGNKILITASDRIWDARAVEDMLDVASSDASVAEEFDSLTARLLRHLGDVMKEGGIYAPEFYRYEQYVYSPSQPAGSKLILVDVEPILQYVLPRPFERIEGSAPANMMYSLAQVCKDIVMLEEKTDTPSSARRQLYEIINDVDPAGSHDVEVARQAIDEALDRVDVAPLEFILEEDDESEDILFGLSSVEAALSLEQYIERRKQKGQYKYRSLRED